MILFFPSLIEYLTDKSTNTPTNTNDDGYKNTNNYMRYVSKTCCSSSNNGAEVPSKYTIMEPTHKDMSPPHMYNALQLLIFLSKPYKNTEDYVDAFSLYKIPTNIYLLQRGTRIMPTMNIYTNDELNPPYTSSSPQIFAPLHLLHPFSPIKMTHLLRLHLTPFILALH